MLNPSMTPNQIRQEGMQALAKALGPVGMERFIQQFDTGKGDYTRERDQWLSDLTIEQIVEEAGEAWRPT